MAVNKCLKRYLEKSIQIQVWEMSKMTLICNEEVMSISKKTIINTDAHVYNEALWQFCGSLLFAILNSMSHISFLPNVKGSHTEIFRYVHHFFEWLQRKCSMEMIQYGNKTIRSASEYLIKDPPKKHLTVLSLQGRPLHTKTNTN